ncbi:MAG: hypothetical protein ACREIA_02965, partial [Opitutaceae bacterium]
MNYLNELRAWEKRVVSWVGTDARLVHVSSHSSDIRVFESKGRIFKIRKLTPASVHGRPNSLEDEYLLLKHLEERARPPLIVPRALSFRYEGEWECLEMEKVDPPRACD